MNPVYRVPLTQEEISFLHTLCNNMRSQESRHPALGSLLRKFSLLTFKIGKELAKPAYVLTPPPSMAERLGMAQFIQDTPNGELHPIVPQVFMKDTEEDNRYVSGDMSAEEKEEYERKIGLRF